MLQKYQFMIIKINCTNGNNDLYLYRHIIVYCICVNGQFGSKI